MRNILRPRNESTEVPLWPVQIILSVKGKENPLLSLEAFKEGIHFNLRPVLVACVCRGAIRFKDTEWMAWALEKKAV